MVGRTVLYLGCLAWGLATSVGQLVAQAALSSNGRVPVQSSGQVSDYNSPDAIIRALYEVISGPAGAARDWNRFRSLFAEGARLIPTSQRPDGTRVMRNWTVEEYISQAGAGLERAGFFEGEIGRTQQQFGQVMHVWSVYESRRSPDDPVPFQRGINSIQLRDDGTRWWVVTILWDSERPDNPIPAEYLKRKPADGQLSRH